MKKIDAETFLAFRYPSNARISPDGDLVAMLLKQPVLDENRYLSDIWIAERKSGAVRRLTARRNVAAYCWMPCGDILFTLAGDKPEKGVATKYYKISPFGGEAEEFACLPIRGGMPVFLEDGRWLVNAQTDLLTDDEDPAPGNETKPRDDSYRVFEEVPFWSNGNGDVSKRRQTLFVCDPKEGCVKRLTPRDFDVYSFDCKGDAVVMTGASFDCTRPHEPGLYTACLRDLTMKEIVAPLGYDISSPVFVDEQTALFQMKKAHVNRYAVGDLCSLDVFSGEITSLHPCDYSMGYGGATTDVSQDSGRGAVACGGKLWFIETEDDGSYVRCCGRDGVFSERLTKDGSTTSIDVKDGYAVIIAQRGDKLPEVYELLPGCEEKQITCFNEEVFKELEVSTPKFMKYTGSDGFEIHGWIMAPIGYEPGKKYPAILNIHGGPRGVFGSVFHHEMQLWAARGYFVLFCNPRGSDGRGEKFANLYGKYGDWDYVNIMEFTDKCLEICPDIDPERLGVTGGSYGGYMTNWIIGHTDRFKAACAQRSISNWITYEGTGDISYWFNPGEHGGNFETDAHLLWDISPMKFADKAKTPTLFIHSDEDYRCYMGEGIAMYTVLKMNGVDARMVLFRGENHGLSRNGRPRSRVRRMEEIVYWMDKYLKEGEENA